MVVPTGAGAKFRLEAGGFGTVPGGLRAVRGRLGVEGRDVGLDHVPLLSGQETHRALVGGPGVPLAGVRVLKGV